MIRSRKLLAGASTLLAIVTLLGAGYVSLQTLDTNARARAQMAHLTSAAAAIQQSSSSSTSKDLHAAAQASYTVAADLPKFISIPAIGVTNAKVIQVGLTSNGAVGTPLTSAVTAWYSGSAKPGSTSGATFIDGHVLPDRAGATAVFGKLHQLASGDVITLTKGDDSKVTYRVVRTANVPIGKFDMHELLTSAEPGRTGLNLMTCAGTYDTKIHSMDCRIEAFAVQSRV